MTSSTDVVRPGTNSCVTSTAVEIAAAVKSAFRSRKRLTANIAPSGANNAKCLHAHEMRKHERRREQVQNVRERHEVKLVGAARRDERHRENQDQ